MLAELKGDRSNSCVTTFGFRSKFSGGSLTGTIDLNGKANSVYKHSVDFFELGFQTQMNFAKPQTPVQFGININLAGM